MNDPSSDGNENVIDIFVLCKSETGAPVNTEHLEQKGYRVTLFSDSAHLFETLRYGKPNLLICDSLSLGEDAFEISRRIKADNDLWMIPVLIMTGSSSLGNLLFVLDCNADNFIAYPYDPAYLLSLIEGMLVTPVERQTPEQIKTQFKIQHDDHLFVVTADRRKLLEFLLSSFEIAVNKTEELTRAISDNTTLRQAAAKADEVAAEQGRVIGILNDTIQQREGAISALNDEVSEKATRIAELSREKEFFLQERDEDKRILAAYEDQNRTLIREKEEAAGAYSTEVRELNERIAALSDELTNTQAELKTTRGELEEMTSRRTEADSAIARLVPAKEQLEKSLRAVTLECEQARSACSAEQNRALAAEQENKSLVLAKAQAEQDLTKIIDELKDTARQQAGDLVTLREELTADKNQINSLENRLAALAAAKEETENSLKKTGDDLRRELDELHAIHDTTTAALNEKTRFASEIEGAYNDQKTAISQMQAQTQALDNELTAIRSELDDKSRRADELEQAYNDEKAASGSAQAQVRSLENELTSLRSALEDKTRSAAESERFCLELKDAGAQALDQIHTLDAEIGELRAALEGERQQHAQTRESLQGALEERDEALSSLQGAHAEVKSDLDSHRDDLAQIRQELSTVADERTTLKGRLEESLAQIRALEDKLHAASGDQADSDKQIRSLSDELGQVKAALEAEREQRRSREEKLQATALEGENAKVTTQQALAEQERLQKMLDSEQNERKNAEERLRSLEEAGEHRIRELSNTLDNAQNRIREFEEQVRLISEEKAEAEARAAALENEIDQARSALADEWEDHMTDNERFAAARETAEEEQALADPAERESGNHAVVMRTTALPAQVTTSPVAVMAVPDPSAESPIPNVTRVEDLFEDEPDADEDPDELPAVSIVHESAPNVGEISFSEDPTAYDETDTVAAGPERIPAEPNDDSGLPDADTMTRPDETGEPEEGDEPDDGSEPAPLYRPIPAGQGIAIDRSQWFDLLKWAHHSGALSQEQRLQIVKMGRLIQKGRRLTNKQDEAVRQMIGLVQSLGYRFT